LPDRLFNKLARSIAPEIYGMENVKKALVLQMAGGLTKETQDKVKIRG
jgi:DNA replication licensing factor MCM7